MINIQNAGFPFVSPTNVLKLVVIGEGCDRTHAEIDEMRRMVKGLVTLAKKMEYENHEDYANAVARSILHKLQQDM